MITLTVAHERTWETFCVASRPGLPFTFRSESVHDTFARHMTEVGYRFTY